MKILNRLFKSKGRHGTHSPFAYGFIEQVLREPTGIKYPDSINNLIEERRLGKTFFRLIQYLDAGSLYLDEHIASKYGWLRELGPSSTISPMGSISQEGLILVDVQGIETYLNMFSDTELKKISFLVLHISNKNSYFLEPFYENPNFNCTIKTWDFSLFLYKEAFKRKQHFNLR
ncbi:MAG TPA: hypothetical protein PKX92_02440 [Edaphocola sp.]|nr:hypothetical protein [Edaphocola sp.]